MIAFVISGLQAGVRGRSFQAVFVFGLLLVGVAYLSSGFSPRHPATVALDIGFSGIRFTLVMLQLFWIQELVAKEIERKTVLHSLAYPVQRASFLLGRYVAVLILGILAAVILGLSLLLAVVAASAGYSQETPVALGLPFWTVIGGLIVDVAVVAAVGLAVATVSTVAIMPLAIGVAFAIGGKALGATVDYLWRGADGDAELTSRLGPVVDVVRWIIPDLSRLDFRYWPMYGLPPSLTDVALAILMGLAYAAVAIAIGILAFRRREFS
jgi:ABC-type transport system involved in multi-copper enzyme maturation permease subunit